MIAIRLTVPIACWRKAHARELVETERVPPPSTCYGALLAFVGEIDRERHRGCRVTAGVVGEPEVSVVVRTFWKIKDRNAPQGSGENAKPDFHQLVTQAEVVIWCDSSEESTQTQPRLEDRVIRAFEAPKQVDRFGGWCLGESTHLINDAWLIRDGVPPGGTRAFVLDETGTLTLPTWVDHVGTARTCYAVGRLTPLSDSPVAAQLPQIPLQS